MISRQHGLPLWFMTGLTMACFSVGLTAWIWSPHWIIATVAFHLLGIALCGLQWLFNDIDKYEAGD